MSKSIHVVVFEGHSEVITDVWEVEVAHTSTGKFDAQTQGALDFAVRKVLNGNKVKISKVENKGALHVLAEKK